MKYINADIVCYIEKEKRISTLVTWVKNKKEDTGNVRWWCGDDDIIIRYNNIINNNNNSTK